MIEIFLIFISLGLVISIIFAIIMNRLRRMKATYRLYAVRDNLVLLVSKDLLNEESALFKYYYKRINMLLQFAPNIGLDQAYKAFLFLSNNKKASFDEALKKAQGEAESILKSKELEIDEVALTVQEYYSAYMEMVLSHSSLTRLAYYAAKHKILKIQWFPESVRNGMAIIKVAGNEIDEIYERRNFA
ncbi:hypothetical protein [Pseudomonas sp. FYR_11]|uniref:hypothetical protein n=1 Tax=Pseudomonas TaxID=286 RepID=UPI00370BE30D